jgi:hypothetical protein
MGTAPESMKPTRQNQCPQQNRALHLPLGALLALGLAMAALGFGAMFVRSAAAQNQPVAPAKDTQGKKVGGVDVPAPLPRGKRLVLKDGKFEVVRSYERQGDRVRFYSLERSDWEEIPEALVDWAATAKAEADDVKKKQEQEQKARDQHAGQIAEDVEVGSSIEIVPGLFLPEDDGAYAIQDKFILPMTQILSQTKLNKGSVAKQILVPVPIIPTKHRIEIAGKRAVLRLSTPSPEFYFRTADAREPEMELVRAAVKGETRQVGVISTDIVGENDEKRDYIPMQKWKVANGVYRFTISQSLTPGEYALSEILADGMNMYVWDFGIDPPGTAPGPDLKAAPKPKQTDPPKPKQ